MGIGVALSPQKPIGKGARGALERAGGSQLFESHVAMAIRSAPGNITLLSTGMLLSDLFCAAQCGAGDRGSNLAQGLGLKQY